MSLQDHSHDQAIDNLLAALGQTTPPAGMEDRILRRLAVRPEPNGLRFGLWPSLLTAVAAAVLLMLFVTRKPWVPRISNAGRVAHAGIGAINPGLKVETWGTPHPGGLAKLQDAETPGVPHVSLLRHGITGSSQETASRVASRQDESSVASSNPRDEAALNQPAPPMPLTDQEKLLLRVARRNDPDQMAGLVRANRELETLLDHAEYETFFAPPPGPTQPAQVNDDWHPAR